MNSFCFSEEQHGLPKEELFKIYSTILKALNLPTVPVDAIKYEDFLINYNTKDYGKKIPVVGCKNDDFEMEIDPSSGKVLFCYNRFIEKNVYGKDSPVFEGEAKPTKNKEEMIKLAENYIKIINVGMPEDAVFKEADYVVSNWRDTKHSYEGEWHVYWTRMAGQYECPDVIAVSINEKYGLESYNWAYFWEYDPPKKEIISKEKAIEISKKYYDKITYKGFELKGPIDAGLYIIQANKPTPLNKSYVPKSRYHARLAWVLRFENNWKDPNSNLKSTSYRQLWIDAETGEVLGGG